MDPQPPPVNRWVSGGFSRSGEAVCVLSAALGPLAPCELLARPRMEEGDTVMGWKGDSRAQGFQR